MAMLKTNTTQNLWPDEIKILRADVPHQLRMLRLSETEEAAIDAYLGKPFDPGQLLKTVKDVLIKHKGYLVEKNQPQEKSQEIQMVM